MQRKLKVVQVNIAYRRPKIQFYGAFHLVIEAPTVERGVVSGSAMFTHS